MPDHCFVLNEKAALTQERAFNLNIDMQLRMQTGDDGTAMRKEAVKINTHSVPARVLVQLP
jgi:hypothetical protein